MLLSLALNGTGEMQQMALFSIKSDLGKCISSVRQVRCVYMKLWGFFSVCVFPPPILQDVLCKLKKWVDTAAIVDVFNWDPMQ